MADNEKTLEELRKVRSELASDVLPPSFAKLYSQYTRLRMKQSGLKGWRDDEFSDRLADAVTLIDAGLSEREIGGEGWREALKRSGELLEWLSHPEMNTEQLPLRLLSAGVYQLAGFPALSMGLLVSVAADATDSHILASLLRADFPTLFDLIKGYWETELAKRQRRGGTFRQINISDISSRLVDETVKALGILCSYMRWGEAERLELAQEKLRNLSDVMFYGTDSYSWLLAKIVAEVVREYITTSMRRYVRELQNGVSDYGKKAFERYLRSNYRARKSLAWHSQVRGIERLLQDGSFALCTPTGSGKTTIAELAIIQSMFQHDDTDIFFGAVGPIVIYLVPSRALATEVEAKLGSVLGNLGSQSVKVTGLYGGIDWGPTDAWVTSPDPTVLICTYEKAEALIRFLGPLFLNRVSLIVIDEAHFVQFNGSTYEDLRNGENRSLRLEMLVNRLLRHVNDKRIIALSAVAKKNESLAHWVTGNESSEPVVTNYRSTRQLIGRLEWSHTGEFEIHYDILNGSYLGFDDEGDGGVPYIPKPFAPFPVPYQQLHSKYIGGENKVGKRQRPYLFWAAMQLAQPYEQGNQHSVLISVTQKVGGYAEDFLYVVNNTLAEDSLPQFFERPTDSTNQELFDKCLDACADYFGTDSYEYQLLEKGVVVHHGSMPGILARLLVELLQKGIVHIALATSTLSEGINLPFETVIVPTLIRDQDTLPITEFMNLAGRAGRPGWGTEGRTLVLLQTATRERSSQKAWRIYNRVLQDITGNRQSEQNATVQSPLGALMSHMERAWSQVTGSHSGDEFFEWLERTVPLEDPATGAELAAEEALDALDGHLLSVLVEQESMTGETMNRSDLEDYLIDVWRKTYARYVVSDTEHWEEVFAVRGQALQERIYPDSRFRRRLYRTSVAPRYGKRILKGYQVIRDHLVTGANYSEWSTEERLQFIIQTVEQISNIGNKFEIPGSHGRGKNAPSWYEIMTWWMNPRGASKRPTKNQVSEWVKFVKRQFEYKFNWGLGTVLALILDDVNAGALQETSIEDWPKTGLPWVVFWLKELITWGTLDPVAAMLLTYSVEFTRSNAETRAQDYYETTNGLDADEVLNAKRIKEWVDRITRDNAALPTEPTPTGIKVSLSRDFSKAKVQEWRVVPITKEGSITWLDPAGYELATCEIPAWWRDRMDATHDFVLNVKSKTIKVSRYL